MSFINWVSYQETNRRLRFGPCTTLVATALLVFFLQTPVIAQSEQPSQGYVPIPYPDPLPDEDVIDLGFAAALHPKFAGETNKECGEDASDAIEAARASHDWILLPRGRVCISRTLDPGISNRFSGTIQSGKIKNSRYGTMLYWTGPRSGPDSVMWKSRRNGGASQLRFEHMVIFGNGIDVVFDMVQPSNSTSFKNLLIRGRVGTVWKIDNIQDVGECKPANCGDDNATFEALWSNIFFDSCCNLGWDFNGYVNASFLNIDAIRMPNIAKFGRGNDGESFMVWLGGKWHSIPSEGKQTQAFLFEDNSGGMATTFIGWNVMDFRGEPDQPETFIRSETANLNVNLIGVSANQNCRKKDTPPCGLKNWILSPSGNVPVQTTSGDEVFNYFGMPTMFGPGVTEQGIIDSLR